MSIRIASLTKRISANGQALHAAMASRAADAEPSQAEQALLAERHKLQHERDERMARALQPKPAASERLVRTHHPEPKDRPKATKESREAKVAHKAAKPHKSRAEKHAEKAAARDAARRAPRKPAEAKGK
jgi:hypothetical protein